MIVAIRYMEPDWEQTLNCIKASNVPYIVVDRKPEGTGSLAEAINRGISMVPDDVGYVWVVTNITFQPEVYGKLLECIIHSGYALIHPEFNSDHQHQQPLSINGWKRHGLIPAPFVEFTAAMVDVKVMRQYPLDEQCPYWGHDIDAGYRLWNDGHKVGVCHDVTIGHTYIRFNARQKVNAYTSKRLKNRRLADEQTREHLRKKYGNEWRDIIFPKTEKQIGAFYDKVKDKIKVHE